VALPRTPATICVLSTVVDAHANQEDDELAIEICRHPAWHNGFA